MDLIQLGGAIAIVVISVLAAVIRSVKGGYLGNVLDTHVRRGDRVDGKLDDIQTAVDDTHEDVQNVQAGQEQLMETVYLLHRTDDDVDEDELRDRLDVEGTDADLFDSDYEHVD